MEEAWRAGYYEGPAAKVNEPRRRARPHSCIEGGRMDKWLQTLERLQSHRLQNQISPFADRTVSMPVLCPDVSSLRRRNQTPSVCPSVCESSSSSLESVHIKAASAAERAQFCPVSPVRFGWLPIQRRVILMDISDNRHDSSRCQKLKSPITPVLLSTPAKLNGPRPNDRPEPVGFRYWRTPEKTPSVLHQASGSVSSEGGQNGPQAWNPKAEMDTGHAGPHPVLRNPARRRGSAPGSFSSSISSITITSRKVTQISKPLSPPTNDLANGRRKALVVKVTELRTKSTSSLPIASTSGCDREEMDHGVVLRRKATIVKMTEQRERFSPAQYRHSYTEGLHENQLTNPSPLNQPLTISLEPGANQWRSQHRSSLSLHLNNPNNSSTEGKSDSKTYKPPRRPLSCDASLFNRTDLGSNAVTHPAFHNKSSPVPQKTNIDLVSSSSSSEARRRSASGGKDGSARKEWDRRLEPISGIKPLTLLKAPDNSADLSADAVLALNAAAVIANIKLQAQQRRTTSHTAAEDRRQNEHRELQEEAAAAAANGKNKTHPADQCVDFVPSESQNDLSETALAPLSLSEALAVRRPDFIQRSQARVQALERRSQERQNSHSSAQIAGTGESLVKSKDRSIMGKTLQLRSRRSYNQLPEARKRREEEKKKKEEEKRKLASRTNRLRAECFKKKLLEQILQRGGNH